MSNYLLSNELFNPKKHYMGNKLKLIEGVYENLITEELNEEMQQAQETGLTCETGQIDSAESPSMIAQYLSDIIKRRLADDALSADEKMAFANRIVEMVSDSNEEKIKESSNMLVEVFGREEKARRNATASGKAIRPQSGFRVSNLFTGGQGQLQLGNEIERDIASADTISIIVSFLKLSGLNLIYRKLEEFCSNPQHRLRIITTTYCGVTEAKAVERLAKLPNTEIRISYNTKVERLHAKSYIFERNSGMNTAYIGSSNLSKSAQTDGLEWNIRVTNVENPHIIKSALATFNQYWLSPNFEDFRVGGIERFYAETKKEHYTGPSRIEYLNKYTILPHQKQILDKLLIERENGLKTNLIVAATGTGKTVISAFDYQYFSATGVRPSKLLFVAHREEILKQARLTYRSVMQNANFGELWVGDSRPTAGIDYLFISVQTFNSRFKDTFSFLPQNYYDYIVIDEAHHMTADSYRILINHFKPKLLIGLTATPERMDGVSLLPDFGGKISAEIRLPQALQEGLLTPFHYYCISDDTDLTDNDLMQGNQYITSKLAQRLSTKERARLIIDRLDYYLADINACRALCFCANKDHADFMATAFKSQGLKAASLNSNNSQERQELNKALVKGELNYLFVVDMFNEGVDIPAVDTVLFLRPTESLTIFLQQLGRGLRLYPGKQQLTVFDFVAQLNQKYDFASRFRSLMLRTDKPLKEQIKEGFTLLPYGCAIHMEQKAQEHVLQNITSAIYNRSRLVKELRSYITCPSLSTFMENIGQDIRLIYKDNNCWTSLKREAGKCDYADDDFTKRFTKGISQFTHINTPAYLRFVDRVMQDKGHIQCDDEREEKYALMLYYTLFQSKISQLGVHSIDEALGRLADYPLFMDEIRQLIAYQLDNIDVKTFPIGHDMPLALEQYGCYTREEIFIIMGRQTPEKVMQGSVTGVFKLDELNTEMFFVTLNKSDADFSPTTMYDDYVVSANRFHWQSQGNDSHKGKGARFVNQRINGKKFLLFVREHKKDGFGNTCPFHCFGLVNYISSSDDRPMNIEWELLEPVMPMYLKSV